MYTTEFGSFNGVNWEVFCKQALKLRYRGGLFQDMPSTFQGDLGIEGFVISTGQVFQCYCPENDSDNKTLYESQRDKITVDIQKLEDNASLLPDYIGKGTKIKEWILIVPKYTNKALHAHARTKEAEVKGKNLAIIDPEFCIRIWELDELRQEFAQVQKGMEKYDASIEPSSEETITDWTKENIVLTDNANRKNAKLIEAVNKLADDKNINKLTHITVTDYLDYLILIEKWKKDLPEDYEKYLEISEHYASRLPHEQILKGDQNCVGTLNSIKGDLEYSYKEAFTFITHRLIVILVNGTIAYWLLRCTLDFE